MYAKMFSSRGLLFNAGFDYFQCGRAAFDLVLVCFRGMAGSVVGPVSIIFDVIVKVIAVCLLSVLFYSFTCE